MSAKDTACLTRCLSTLATISVAAPSSPVNGSCLLLTATSRKNITSIALLHFQVTWLKYARLLENFGIVVRSVCCEMYCKHIKHKHPAPRPKDIHPVSNSWTPLPHSPSSRIQVCLGEHNIKKTEGTEQFINTAKVIPHPNYNSQNQDNDIMLSKAAVLDQYVGTVALPSGCASAGARCLVSGWGNTSGSGSKWTRVDYIHKVTVLRLHTWFGASLTFFVVNPQTTTQTVWGAWISPSSVTAPAEAPTPVRSLPTCSALDSWREARTLAR